MEKFKKFQKNTLITLLAFAVPAFIMMLILVIGQFAPFGKVSILVADMRYQFVDYFGYMKQIFFGNDTYGAIPPRGAVCKVEYIVSSGF